MEIKFSEKSYYFCSIESRVLFRETRNQKFLHFWAGPHLGFSPHVVSPFQPHRNRPTAAWFHRFSHREILKVSSQNLLLLVKSPSFCWRCDTFLITWCHCNKFYLLFPLIRFFFVMSYLIQWMLCSQHFCLGPANGLDSPYDTPRLGPEFCWTKY